MDEQKEALRRIVTAVEAKFVEAQEVAADLENDIRSLTEHHQNALMDLNSQFEALQESLEQSKQRMNNEIKETLKSKKVLLETRLKTFIDAERDTEDLLEVSKKTLLLEEPHEFAQGALQVKDRVTMSPMFRLALAPLNVETECHMLADFDRELKMMKSLKFLPIPEIPIIEPAGCFTQDNSVTCSWRMPNDDNMIVCDNEECAISTAADMSIYSHAGPSSYEHFLLQYRQVEKDENLLNKPWISVENIASLSHKIQGLIFDHAYLQFRVQAWNKGLGGSYSATYLIPTTAFNFAFDANASHANLKVVSESLVEWDTTATKAQDRTSSANSNRSASPAIKTMSPRRSKAKDRFTGESYTILGDSCFSERSESYYEASPHPDCKTYTIGVASSTLGRFDQVGKNANSWGIHVTTWMQNSFVAKYNNKVKNLEAKGSPPLKYGVYLNTETGVLSFHNCDSEQCLHTFKIKKNGSLFPAFLLWFGSIEIRTGLEVPSWVITTRSESRQENVVSPTSE